MSVPHNRRDWIELHIIIMTDAEVHVQLNLIIRFHRIHSDPLVLLTEATSHALTIIIRAFFS